MSYSRIEGTGSYLPKRILTNAELEKIVDTTNEWIVTRTGIHERRIIGPEDSTVSMAIEAARQAIQAAEMTPKDIQLILVATSTPDKFFPSCACCVQAALGVDGCPAFDLSAACAGFNYALTVADQFIRNHTFSSALVIASESMSRIIDWKDRSTCVLFGDGAGALVLKSASIPGIISSHLHAAGSYNALLSLESGLKKNERPVLKMQGSEIFKIAVNTLSDVLEETLAGNKINTTDINWLIPHQANLRIIKSLTKKLKMTMKQVVITLDKHGNTSAASIPIALDIAVRDGRIRRGQLLLMESFGAGLVWGSALIRY